MNIIRGSNGPEFFALHPCFELEVPIENPGGVHRTADIV
jgi:hypothetical protein